jgi:hypothetical protein
MGSGEFRRMDANYATRLVVAPIVLLLLWRYSFDFCESKSVDAESYLEQHLDVFINGLMVQDAQEERRVDEKKGAKPAKVISIEKKGRAG